MSAAIHGRRKVVAALLVAAIYALGSGRLAEAADAGQTIIPRLQERFGLSEAQARGSIGALLVFVREQLTKTQFDELARCIPNADFIMRDVRARGIVTMPLDDIGDYEATLAKLGIGQPLASQIAPAVLEYLGDAGYQLERNMLARVLD
jgi:hypothetical protein